MWSLYFSLKHPTPQEVEALTQLANALNALIKSQVIKYVKGEIIKRTVLASLMAALSPTAWLSIGQIIGGWVVRYKQDFNPLELTDLSQTTRG